MATRQVGSAAFSPAYRFVIGLGVGLRPGAVLRLDVRLIADQPQRPGQGSRTGPPRPPLGGCAALPFSRITGRYSTPAERQVSGLAV